MKTLIMACLSLSILTLCAFDAIDGSGTAIAAGDPVISAVDQYIAKQTESGKIQKDSASWKTRLPKFPALEYTKGTTYVWKLETSVGEMELEFLPETAPNHVSNFIYLTQLGFFNGLNFHRVIPGFMAQGGCPLGRGNGGPGYKFAGEYDSSVKHTRGGLLSMANAGQGTDGSQFFITFTQTPWLDGKHTIFGKLRAGESVLKQIEALGTRSSKPSEELTIEKASIVIESKSKVEKEKKPEPKKAPAKKPQSKKESR
jgi:cyclophilin family peptidyl-prolyl cis-trans isomerase